MRLAGLFVPLFPLAARLRSEPELKGESVAIFEGNGNSARVVAATRPARKAGLQPGMTLPQARALLPGLIARGRDRESERAAQETLLEIADTFSPRVEDAGEGVVYLDLEGLPSLAVHLGAVGAGLAPARPSPGDRKGRPYGTKGTAETPERKPSAEMNLARSILASVEKSGLPVRVGIASSKLAARVAAGLPDTPTVVPEGEEAAFLAPLPLDKLAPEIEIAATLERWGIRSIGDFARLPEGEVASRLGESGRTLHATARGSDPRPLEPRLPPSSFCEGMELEWPIVTLEPFLFLGNAALERLVVRLESQGLACSKLEILLNLDPDGCDARGIALPAPSREVKTLLTLVRLELEARPPGAPVCGFVFTAHPDKPRRAQLSLFGPAALSPDRLSTTIARLAALLGADRVGSPRTVNGHRPERFSQVSYAPPPPPALARSSGPARGLLAIRVLRPPVPLEVIVSPVSPVSSDAVGEGWGGRAPSRPSEKREPCHPERSEGSALVVVRPETPPNGIPLPDSFFLKSRQSTVDSQQPPAHRTPHTAYRPISLRSLAGDGAPEIHGPIKIASGPWSLEEAWWSEAPADRSYWDVELSEGGLYRIYRDRTTGSWFADGIYD